MASHAEISAGSADLNDAALFADGPPHEVFAEMRAGDPVRWTEPSEADDLPGYFSITRFDDIVTANKDWETFSSAEDGITIRPGAILPKEVEEFAFICMDPPDHRRHRALLAKVFTAGAVAAREDDIRAIANGLIDGFIESGECDLVADFCARFPMTVTSNMLGVPEADHDKLFAWTNAMADTEMPSDEAMETMGEMFGYINDLIAKKRAEPADDLLSRLIAAEVDGESLSDLEVVLHFVQITAGGNETTRDAFAGGMEALMANPDQRRALIDDTSRIGTAVEEVLRWHSPIHCMARTATRDTEISGTPIAEGDRVVLWYCSGNRDEAANPDPDRFDVTRDGVNQVSFGGGGVHYCLGNQLSRLELSVVLGELLRRIPDTELAGEVVRQPSTVFHSMLSVPVSFEPGRREG